MKKAGNAIWKKYAILQGKLSRTESWVRWVRLVVPHNGNGYKGICTRVKIEGGEHTRKKCEWEKNFWFRAIVHSSIPLADSQEFFRFWFLPRSDPPLMEANGSAGAEHVEQNVAVAQKHHHNNKRKELTQQPIFPKDEKILQELGTDLEKMLFLEGFVSDPSSKRRSWLWRGCLPDVLFTEKENRDAEGNNTVEMTILLKSSRY